MVASSPAAKFTQNVHRLQISIRNEQITYFAPEQRSFFGGLISDIYIDKKLKRLRVRIDIVYLYLTFLAPGIFGLKENLSVFE